MPTVPNSFVPQVNQTASNAPAMSAPGVAPVQSAAPEQVQEMGAAMSRAGLTAYQKGQQIQLHIQDQVDDANVKAAETRFIQAAADTLHGENGYLNRMGADALNGYDDTAQSLAKAKQDILDSLGNDVQKRIFGQVAQRHLVTFGGRMSEHRATQRVQYASSEAVNRADTMRAMAQNVEVGSADQNSYIATGLSELRNAFSIRGIAADSEQYKKAERDYRTLITQDNVNRLMVAGKYQDAKTLLGEQMKAGHVDADAADRMRASIESNVQRVEVINTADKIFASHKGLEATDLESLLAKVDEQVKDPERRRDVRSLVSLQFSQARAIADQKYRDNLNDVVNYKYEHGSLKGIDPAKWGSLDAKDRAELSKPAAAETDLNTWYNFVTKPETLTVAGVRDAFMRGRLSKGDFRSFTERAMTQQNKADDVLAAEANVARVKYYASGSGMNVYGTQDPDEKRDFASLVYQVQSDINADQQIKGRKLTQQEKDQHIKDNLKKIAVLKARGWYNPKRWLGDDYVKEDDFGFKSRNESGVIVPSTEMRQFVIEDMQRHGVSSPADDQISRWYQEMLKH